MNLIFRFFERFARPFSTPPSGWPPSGGLGFIWHHARQIRGPFGVMLTLGFLQALVEASLFVFVGLIVDMMAAGPRESFLADNAAVLLAMAFIVLVARFIIWAGSSILEEQIIVPDFFSRVRWQGHRTINRQDVTFFDDEQAGRISQKVWQSGQAAGDFMISLLQIIWFIAVFAATTLILIAGLDIRIMLVVVLWIALVVLIAFRFVPRIRDRGRATAEAGAVVTGRMVDGYANIRTVRLYGGEENQNAHIREAWADMFATLKRFTRTIAGMRIASQGLSSIMLTVVGAFSIFLYQTGSLSSGEVAVVLALCLRLNLLMNRLLGLLNGLFRNFGTVQNSAELIARQPHVVNAPDARELIVESGLVRFDNVRFAYPGTDIVIDDLSFCVPAGQKVGIVGQSGVGKSTLMNLLLRFHDVDSGTISIDGTDIAGVTQVSLRHALGVVQQDTSLMHRSIRDNIAFGRPLAGDGEIAEAARKAKADGFVSNLRDTRGRSGYDTYVGERGVKLSGGQRQRIALARVFLKNAPILLLDEATSALDSEVEAAIQESLVDLMEGKTVIAIAHRLSTIAHLDRLLVMEDGCIVEDGSHEELIALGGRYASLWARQSGGLLTPTRPGSAVSDTPIRA